MVQDANPYSPPQAAVADVDPDREIPDRILEKIRGARNAALVSAAFTLAFVIAAYFGVGFATRIDISLLNLTDVAVILGFAYGIHRKSRACAVGILVYFIVSKAMMYSSTGRSGGGILGLVFLYFYVMGVYGTFAYHRELKRMATAAQ